MSHYTPETVPDIRLAKAFNFTMDDLQANRSGILSWRQRGISDWIAFRIVRMLRHMPLFSFLFSGSSKKEPFVVTSICGRIKLVHNIEDKRLIRSSLFYEYYQLWFPGHNQKFRVTRQQYHALVENLKYRVYYQDYGEQRHILSIERIIGHCDQQ